MKDCFLESLGQKCGCTLHTGAHYTQQNMVLFNIHTVKLTFFGIETFGFINFLYLPNFEFVFLWKTL